MLSADPCSLLPKTRASFTLLATALALGVAQPAVAANVLIQFDFTGGSSISLLGGTIVTPPDGTMDFGSAQLSVEATAPSTFVAGGAVVLENATAGGTVSKDVAGQADVSGSYAATQVGSLAGTLAAGENGADFVDDLVLSLNIALGCTGTGCGILGLPVSESGPSAFAISFLPITDLGTPGAAQISAVVPIEVGGVLGELTLVGVEVSRSFVPEPATALLAGVALAGFLGRRRRPSA